ncbi:hypothetical protein SE17_30150 [Kouleothrix aurantiaca]|uniref:Aminoglycoside phosphotransferase domain-containing protein n=1 Tax=Kouleothrix aurantiaca TaxID=186479 RepID=A0A0P9DJ54_9CHLR|nr:hypothetical protein SE17_30150 [Kouleothrix aurantiaca]
MAFARIAAQIALQGKLLRAWALDGGISARMTALEIALPAGESMRAVVRQPGAAALARNPRAAHDEYALLGLLQAHGVAAPRPLLLDDSGASFPDPFLAIEYIDGAMDFALANPADAARQLATQLASINQINAAVPGLAFLPAPPAECGPPANAALPTAHIRAALVAAPPPPAAPALLHGDFWPGNVLWRGGRLAAVIDWEDAALGDPLRDLAISRLDLAWIYGRDAMHAFTAHYQAQAPLGASRLARWDLIAALRLARLVGNDLQGWAAFFHPFGRTDITAQHIRDHYNWFVAQAIAGLQL